MHGKRPSYLELLRALTALHYLANGTSLAWHPSNMDARVLIGKADGMVFDGHGPGDPAP